MHIRRPHLVGVFNTRLLTGVTLFIVTNQILLNLIVIAEPYHHSGVGIHIPVDDNNFGIGLIGNSGGTNNGAGLITETRCPRVCKCNGLTVDCSHRSLTLIPRKIPAETERLM